MSITRRLFLRNTAAAGAVATTGGAASAIEAEAAPAAVTKVNRLARELSHAMDDWMVDLGHDGEPDVWKAHILPASHAAYPVSFEHIGRTPAVNGPGPNTAVSVSDPLVDAVNAYKAGLADFLANAPEDDAGSDAYADATYGPPMQALESWDGPAVTREGAVAALQCAATATRDGDIYLTGPMIAAALGYLQREARS